MRGVAYGLRRLAVGAQEAAAHPFTVAEAGFACDFLDWQPTLLEHVPRGFKAEILDRPGSD